jgi:hypothetical protein
MKRIAFSGLCLALGACANQTDVSRGMTEGEVAERTRVPDRVIMRTCGTATPKPFPCKVFVYQESWRDGVYTPGQSIVFEDVRGQWIVSQWL